jgi:8-oxo-dGTP diphosphatase
MEGKQVDMSKEKFKLKFAVYLVLRDGKDVLLSQRQNTGYKDGYYSLVAGHVDGGETAEDAMVREAREEVGITIEPTDLKFVYATHRLNENPDDEYVDFFFECSKWHGNIENLEPKKCGELLWANIEQLPRKIIEDVRDVLETYEKGAGYKSYRGLA